MNLRTQLVAIASLSLMAGLLTCGCRPTDQRLTELAQSSLEQQSRQSEAVAENSRQVAEATRELVQAEAEARDQFIQSRRELQSEIVESYQRIDEARQQLEAERKLIAAQRHRDPIIAEAIGGVALLISALLPFLIIGQLLYSLNRNGPDEAAVSSLLISEIANRPQISSEVPRLSASTGASANDAH
jgi:hypothetical protein